MKIEKRYHGVVVPMVTPITNEGKADTEAVKRIITNLAAHNVAPLIMGTTGEGNSVPADMGVELIKAAKSAAQGKVTIYAGLPGNCISEQLAAAGRFIDAGADVIAATLPCYYSLTAEQMENYYTTMANELTVPLMLYNINITTHMSIPMDVIERLSHHNNIVGLKDSQNDLERMAEALKLFADRDDFSYFCGCAANSAKALALGADGIVPSVGNYLPKMYQDLYEAGIKGDNEKAEELQQKTIEIGKINTAGLTLGQSLAGLKAIMHKLGLCETFMLPPLTALDKETEERILSDFEKIMK